jgi:predicted histone-like DNA-binding protein
MLFNGISYVLFNINLNIMPLLYKARQSALKTKDGKKKWYPSLVKIGKVINTQELGELIAEKSSLSPGDVHNVVRTMMTTIRHELLSSRSVQLDGLGIFTMMAHANGNGVETFEEVNAKQVNKLTVHFSPTYTRNPDGGITRAMYEDVSYERIDTKFSTTPVTPGTFSVTDVTLNGTPVPQGSGELTVSSGNTLQIIGSHLGDVGLKATVLIGGPTAQPSTVVLASIGGVTVDASGAFITVNITMNGLITCLLRADNDSIIYNFE